MVLHYLYNIKLPEASGGHVLNTVDWMYLTPDNVIVTQQRPDAETDAIEPWFGVPYRTVAGPIPRQPFRAREALQLPQPNPFLPDALTLHAQQAAPRARLGIVGLDLAGFHVDVGITAVGQSDHHRHITCVNSTTQT